jgi:DNA-directed RNA polymerase specialized sigma24 family protein
MPGDPVGTVPKLKKDWVVTPAAFENLLAILDSNREQAGVRYEQIRQKLSSFFRWRGCHSPEEFVDLTMDRVARRLAEGAQVEARDVSSFFHGVAANVLREHWKDVQKAQVTSLDDSPAAQNLAKEDPNDVRHAAAAEKEERLGCLDGCVERLPKAQLHIMQTYHRGAGREKIDGRNHLAAELGIPLNALRIRAFRIRGELETCVSDCVRRHAS